jgi:hypothetical protein
MGGIIPFALQLLTSLPGLIASGEQGIALIEAHTAALKAMVAENRSPTQDEWDALNSVLGGLEAQLDAPVEPVAEPAVAPVTEPIAPAANPEPIAPAAPLP